MEDAKAWRTLSSSVVFLLERYDVLMKSSLEWRKRSVLFALWGVQGSLSLSVSAASLRMTTEGLSRKVTRREVSGTGGPSLRSAESALLGVGETFDLIDGLSLPSRPEMYFEVAEPSVNPVVVKVVKLKLKDPEPDFFPFLWTFSPFSAPFSVVSSAFGAKQAKHPAGA